MNNLFTPSRPSCPVHGQPSFRKADHEACQMARLKVIRREWIEKEDWHKAEEVFTL